MKFVGLTFILLFCGFNLLSQTPQEAVDQYVIYPKVYIGMTTQQVVDSFGIEKIQVDPKNNYPGNNLLDSNLFDEVTITVPKVDTVKYLQFGAPQLHLRLYKGKVFSIHYTLSAELHWYPIEIGVAMRKCFGSFEKAKFYNKVHYETFGPTVFGYNFIETWEGNENITGIANKYLLYDRYEIEIVQWNKEGYKNYVNAWNALKAQNKIIKKTTTKEIKGGNADMAEILKDFIDWTAGDLPLSSLEKKMPHSKKTTKTIYKKQIDEQGAFWGIYETDKKLYIQNDYEIYDGDDHLLTHIFAVTDTKNRVVGIISEFKQINSVKQLEKIFTGPDIVFSHQKENMFVYKDLLDQIKIVLLTIEGTELSKFFFVFKKDLQNLFEL